MVLCDQESFIHQVGSQKCKKSINPYLTHKNLKKVKKFYTILYITYQPSLFKFKKYDCGRNNATKIIIKLFHF